MAYIKNEGGSNSNIRDGGYTSAGIIGTLGPGQTLTLLTTAPYNSGYDWFVVDYNGRTGFVANAGSIGVYHSEYVDVKNRLHWNYYGMNPVEYKWHSDMRLDIQSRMPYSPYFFDNFARVGFDFFFCYGPHEAGHVYTPYPYSISFHGMTNGYYWNARDFGQGGYVRKYFDFRAECENKWGNTIYDHDGTPLKTPSGAARLPGVPENVNMTYGHLYTALKMGVCVYIRSWARTHSAGTAGGATGYIYSGYWDGVNNVPGSSHTFDNGLGICHPRCVVVQDSIGARSENICKAKLRVHGKARVWNGKDCYPALTQPVNSDNVYKVAIMAAVQDEIQGLSGNDPNANAGFDTPRGAKQIFRQDIVCTDAQDIDFSFNPIELFGESKRGKRIALRVWYKYPDAYDKWNTYGPDYEAYRENMKVDGHIPFPSTEVNRVPNMWYETSCELRKDNAAVATDFLAKGNEPNGDEYKSWTTMTFDTKGIPNWAGWVEIKAGANNNHSNIYVDFYDWAVKIIGISGGSLTLANLLNGQVCTELFAFDGFGGSDVWQNCPTVKKWQAHAPRFDMKPRSVVVNSDKPAGDKFTFTLSYDYPISGCRHMLIICPENESGQAIGSPVERYILGTSWRDWNFNLTNWSASNTVTVNLPDYYGDEYRGRNIQLIHGVISPWGWETTNFWNTAGIKKVRFNEYPVTQIAGVRVNNIGTSNNILNFGTYTQTGRDMNKQDLGSIIPGGYVSISGYIECNDAVNKELTTSLGIAITRTSTNARDWIQMINIKMGLVYKNKTYFSGVFKIPDDCQPTGLAYCWSQINIPAGTAGYSVTFSNVKYNFFKAGISTPENYFNTGDVIDVSTIATDQDGIKNHLIGLLFNDGQNKKTVTNVTNKNVIETPSINIKSILTGLGLDYKTYVGKNYLVRASATDTLDLAKDVYLTSNPEYSLVFDYKPGINLTLSNPINSSTVINLSPTDYTVARKYQIQIKRSTDSTWKTIYSSSANETRNIAFTLNPTEQGYTDADRGKVFNIRGVVISNTGMFESDWVTTDFTWGAPPVITLNSIDVDYDYKDGVTRNGRIGSKATFRYNISAVGASVIEIQATVNGLTKTILTKNVSTGNTSHNDLIDFKTFFSNVYTDYDMTFTIKGTAFGLTSIVTSTNDYGTKGKMVFLEPFNKGSITVGVTSSGSKLVGTTVHGINFKLTATSPNASYAKTRAIRMNKFTIYKGISGTAETSKTEIITVDFNGSSVQALNYVNDFIAENVAMSRGYNYKFKIQIDVYWYGSVLPAYSTMGDWTDYEFRFSPKPTPATLIAPINAGLSNNAVPCRRPVMIFNTNIQSEEGNKDIDVVEVKWNGSWIRSDNSTYVTRFDNLATNNDNRIIKFYPPTDSTNNNVDAGVQVAIRSKVTQEWNVTDIPLIMVDPQSIRKNVGNLIEIYSEPRDFINRLRRAYNLSNYSFPTLTAKDTPITRDNLINCLAIAQNEVATKINSYTGTKQLPAISYQNLEYINASQTDEVYTKLATFGTV